VEDRLAETRERLAEEESEIARMRANINLCEKGQWSAEDIANVTGGIKKDDETASKRAIDLDGRRKQCNVMHQKYLQSQCDCLARLVESWIIIQASQRDPNETVTQNQLEDYKNRIMRRLTHDLVIDGDLEEQIDQALKILPTWSRRDDQKVTAP
jgi:hypothetical protein